MHPPRPRLPRRDAVLALLAGVSACMAGPASGADDYGETESDTGNTDVADDLPAPFECPSDGVRESGRHRLFVQGHDAPPLEDGTWPFLHEWTGDDGDAILCDDANFVCVDDGDGVWQPGDEPCPLGPSALVHGEHFLVGVGAFVEFTATLCDDITGRVTFYVPNFDENGSEALHQLFVVHDDEEFLVAQTIDDEAGQNGYNPFVRVVEGNDPVAIPGDRLKLRSTNLNGVPFSVMVFSPPSEYESWITVDVP